jgi:hypothetical protein
VSDPADRVQPPAARLAAVAGALTAFTALAIAMLAQLATGWQLGNAAI